MFDEARNDDFAVVDDSDECGCSSILYFIYFKFSIIVRLRHRQ